MKHLRIWIILILLSNRLYAQKTSQIRETPVQKISRQTGMSEDKAAKVFDIQNAYKEKVRKIISNKNLIDQTKRMKIDLLIIEKDLQLAKVLSPMELDKFNHKEAYPRRLPKKRDSLNEGMQTP